jgi:hypothetical protein
LPSRLEHPHDDQDHDRLEHGKEPPPAERESTEDLADALVQICASYLGGKVSTADNPDTYQVIVHAGVRAVTGMESADVSAETLPVWHPAHPDRCHLDDGPAVSPATLALLSCNGTISTMIHDLSGAVIDVGRRTRNIPPALRRALRERDHGRCRYPGYDSRRTAAHHIRHWANSIRRTTSSPPTAAASSSTPKDGTPIPACPQLPRGSGNVTSSHDAVIRPITIVPPHSGERLDLALAIWIAFANARTKAAQTTVTGSCD